MRKIKFYSSFVLLVFALFFLRATAQQTDADLLAKANTLAHSFIIVDTHIDVPYRFTEGGWEDISQRTVKGNFDYVRAKAGGLNAPFMSIYVPSGREPNMGTAAKPKFVPKGAKSLADSLIDLVEKFQSTWPTKFAVATSTADVKAQSERGLVSLPMGMENGSPVEGSMENLRHFYNRGIRYITLTHGRDNHICDSSYDTTHTWKGLSPFGKQVVAEMNRLGIMVDISHVSDDVFWQVMKLTKAPVIASHSSCRVYTPGWQRNMADNMITALAKNDGVIMIAFGRAFLNGADQEHSQKLSAYLMANKISSTNPRQKEYIAKFNKENPPPVITAADVAKHIDHVVKIAGVDHVGFGSDFDGVDDELPDNLRDVSQYPNVIYELLKLGYSEQDIQKICGGNLLRVWAKVEQVAKDMQGM